MKRRAHGQVGFVIEMVDQVAKAAPLQNGRHLVQNLGLSCKTVEFDHHLPHPMQVVRSLAQDLQLRPLDVQL